MVIEYLTALASFTIHQETIEGTDDEDVKRMVAEYEPEREFVIVLLKPEERTSSYRVQAVENVQRGRPKQR